MKATARLHIFLLLACSPLCIAAARADDNPLEEVVVTASLRARGLALLPASASILDSTTLGGAGVQHFEDVLGLVPGLNWAAGTSRPRYFQLRGIGELEQYQGAPNPSVGLLIDDIDFSGIGMPATLFDVERIEVLRGPQGTVYGANALAGLISIRSEAPKTAFEASTQLSVGDYGVRSAGAVVGDGVDDGAIAWRVAAQRYQGDGFRRNVYLGRDDTNGFDEGFVRGKLHWQAGEQLRLDLTALLSDTDNGYDAWTLDRSRNTRSDKPGIDAQHSRAFALRSLYDGIAPFELLSITTFADSDIDYAFDGDWASDAFWGAAGPHDFFESILRDRRTASQELRLTSRVTPGAPSWVAGVYTMRLTEDYDLRDDYNGEVARALLSDYASTNLAAYGEVELPLTARLAATLGVRGERRSASYEDSAGLREDPVDEMIGGALALTMQWQKSFSQYITLSRGYKAGGFNIGTAVPEERRLFQPEYLWNLETGVRMHSDDRRFAAQASLFYMRRYDQQVYTSLQLDPDNPLDFVQITDNASGGENRGLEAESSLRLTPRLTLGAGVALLHTRFIGYRFGELDLDGRAQAHAPEYQYNFSAEYRAPRGWFARADLQGMAEFYFDTSNDQRSQSYRVVNLRAGIDSRNWSASVWTRNLLNAPYQTRGFFFGNEPPDFIPTRYVQQGDPRQLGATITVRF
ncbi:MAG: TonB-dependent receptor plug domain-containing protein [Steroidobacteraceae bacterium]